MRRRTRLFQILVVLYTVIWFGQICDAQSLVYENAELSDGIGSGKHIVFLAGDHEYRSEETLPALARILSKHHGFKCTVLFNVDPDTGFIEPGNNNMPGTEALAEADLMVVFLRFQTFPDEQMKPIADYLARGGPVVGLRTSTHAFQFPKDSKFAKFDSEYKGKEFEKGFGRQILGEAWAGHYGTNHKMATRLDIVESAKSHPILRGVDKPWAQSGGYWTEPMANSKVLAMAQPLESMNPDAEPAEGKKACPGVWTRTYKSESGEEGRVFTTTYGASEDILDDDFRRLVINGCIWACGMEEKISPDAEIGFVGPYNPVTFGNLAYRLDVLPIDLAGWDSPIMSTKREVQPRVRWGQPRPKRTPKRNVKNESDSNTGSGRTKTLTGAAMSGKKKLAGVLQLKKGDRICLVGNELGERMQHQNFWETKLYEAFPEHELVVRNLCFPGDEPQTRIRSKNFGTPDSHLSHSKASVILFFFGFNESFAGEKGLKKFEQDISKLIEDTRKQDYDGDGEPTRMVFISPTPFEKTDDPNLVNADKGNERLELYVNKLSELAANHKVGFVDVFHPMKAIFENMNSRLTRNGYHLNETGYLGLSALLQDRLFGIKTNTEVNEKIRGEVADKNFHWWHRYRAVNGFSIYGDRGNAGKDGSGTYNNRDVMERERLSWTR